MGPPLLWIRNKN